MEYASVVDQYRTSVRTVVDVTVAGLAVDWIADNLYWAEEDRGNIVMSRLDGRYRTVLISGLTRPKSINVNPLTGFVLLITFTFAEIHGYVSVSVSHCKLFVLWLVSQKLVNEFSRNFSKRGGSCDKKQWITLQSGSRGTIPKMFASLPNF